MVINIYNHMVINILWLFITIKFYGYENNHCRILVPFTSDPMCRTILVLIFD